MRRADRSYPAHAARRPADESTDAPSAGPSLGEIARKAGCRLSEFDRDPGSNPPVSGRVSEHLTAPDGSYVGRRSPSTLAAVHALLHGRVVMEYRPDLPIVQVAWLDRFVRREPAGALLFANFGQGF